MTTISRPAVIGLLSAGRAATTTAPRIVLHRPAPPLALLVLLVGGLIAWFRRSSRYFPA